MKRLDVLRDLFEAEGASPDLGTQLRRLLVGWLDQHVASVDTALARTHRPAPIS